MKLFVGKLFLYFCVFIGIITQFSTANSSEMTPTLLLRKTKRVLANTDASLQTTSGNFDQYKQMNPSENSEGNYAKGVNDMRTATGGLIYTLMVMLTVVAFLSNGAFRIYVFWLSK